MNHVKSGHWAWEFATQRRPKLLARAKIICGNESDAEDLVQDTLLEFGQTFEKIAALPDERRCEGWLMTALNHRFIDKCRKKKVQAQGAKDLGLQDEPVAPQDSPVSPVYDQITDQQFDHCLQQLSPKLRTTFERFSAGMTYQELSRIEGVPVGTIAKRLFDARAKLRELLQGFIRPEVH